MTRRTINGSWGGRAMLAGWVAWSLAAADPMGAQSLLARLGTGGDAGPVTSVAAASLTPRRAATAVRTAAGNLRVIVWDIDEAGGVVRRGSGDAGAIQDAVIASLGPDRVVTAVRQGDGKLAVITWSVDSSGQVQRLGTARAGTVGIVDVATLGTAWVVTAVQTASNDLKLISWRVYGSGSIDRRMEAQAGPIGDLSIASYGYRQLVTAVRAGDGTLKVINWTMQSSGQFIRLGSATGPAVTRVRVAMGAADRAVTAARRSDGTLQVAAWDLDLQSGAVTSGGSAGAGEVGQLAIAPLGGTKVVTAVRQGDGRLKLISWQIIDEVIRLDEALAGEVSLISAAPLFVGNDDRASGENVSWDRIVTAVRQKDQALKVIPWTDRALGMIRSAWGPGPGIRSPHLSTNVLRSAAEQVFENESTNTSIANTDRPIVASPTPGISGTIEVERARPGQSPGWSVRFEPEVEGVDPMVAVGEKYVIVSQQGRIKFFDRNGHALPGKAGFPANLSATEFFGGFIALKEADGSVNRHNVNLYLRFPPTTDPLLYCYPTKDPVNPCIGAFYDTRVAYDSYRKRFLVLSAARHQGLGIAKQTDPAAKSNPIVRRFFAIAVSNTEDPRDGFRQYMSTEGNYADWPRMAVNDGILVVAHNAAKAADDLRPMGYVFAIDDLRTGNRAPRNWKIAASVTGGGSLRPVIHHGDTGGWTYLLRPRDSSLDVYSFQTTATMWHDPPKLPNTTAAIGEALSGFREGIHYRSGKIYLAGARMITEHVPDQAPRRWSVRVVRIPIALGGGGVPQVQSGVYQLVFGRNAIEDDPSDFVSYEVPSIAVNHNGDMLVVYGRVPISTVKPLFQEARYSIIYADSRGLQRSRLLKAGEFLHTTVQEGETQPIPITYYRYSWNKQADKDWIDYGNAVVDPSDDTSFWMAHEFADQETKQFKMVVGKVTP